MMEVIFKYLYGSIFQQHQKNIKHLLKWTDIDNRGTERKVS
jgi:hypothetical protein